ncbi:MAG: threonylcarbamoyl-AMP synthase [Candidatus Levybacteria bacterium]|nr:threonylcarbamoyl-AMP synthase [Candidatus Levybacteria bacterium]
MNKKIKQAIEVLRQGGIVIFPTDTAFGIGCRMDIELSVKRLFDIRKRPKEKALPVLFDSKEKVLDYVWLRSKKVEKIMDRYWPGALTIVLKAKENVPFIVRGGKDTVGVRVPDHKFLLSIIKDLGIPLLGPSANFSGEDTPFKLSEINKELIRKVDFVLEGDTKFKGVSTVIDYSGNEWNILRQGILDIRL